MHSPPAFDRPYTSLILTSFSQISIYISPILLQHCNDLPSTKKSSNTPCAPIITIPIQVSKVGLLNLTAKLSNNFFSPCQKAGCGEASDELNLERHPQLYPIEQQTPLPVPPHTQNGKEDSWRE
jgi:hypothetical protein